METYSCRTSRAGDGLECRRWKNAPRYPAPCTLEVYRSEDGRWVVVSSHGGPEVVWAEPFEAVDVDLSRWWREPVT